MRKGRLIGEDSPNNVINMYGGSCLDDVLVTLCKIDDESNLKNMNCLETIASYKKLDDNDSLKTLELISYNKSEYSRCFTDNSNNEFILTEDNSKEKLDRKLSGSLTKIKTLTKRNFLISYRTPA